jgi:glycosyltransferase involved in cell wall biosynthesis
MTSSSGSGPLISVIIPTRERCETLRSTLQTCVDQDYGHCEIIVSDNFSQDETRAVVASAMDSRVRYVNTGRRVSMSHNWEYALSQATGDYVTVIGDDDALLPGALSFLAALVVDTGTKAVSWNFASYFWPSCIHAPARNLLVVPCTYGLERRAGPEMLRRALAFEQGYTQLPYFYKGLISKDLVNEVRSKSGSVFFHSQIPDIYSAVALSLVTDKYFLTAAVVSQRNIRGKSRSRVLRTKPERTPCEGVPKRTQHSVSPGLGTCTIPRHSDC